MKRLRESMTAFYDNLWHQRLGPLEALRQAQLSTLRGGTVAGKGRGIGAAEPEPVTLTVCADPSQVLGSMGLER